LPAIRDRPSVELTHILDEGADLRHLWTTYVRQPIPVRRPPSGHADISLPCGRCGLPIDLRIYSARATLGLRWSGRIPALAVVGFFWLLLWGFNDGVRLSVDGRKWRVRRRGFHALRLPRR